MRALGVKHDLLDEGLDELDAVIDGCAPLRSDRVEVEADLSIARGLDYYTGTVFETYWSASSSSRSVGSRRSVRRARLGRADTYPGVGISLGVSRHARAR